MSAVMALASSCSTSKTQQLTILSYNIHHGAGIDKKLDLQRIAKIISEVKPDIVALQEGVHQQIVALFEA